MTSLQLGMVGANNRRHRASSPTSRVIRKLCDLGDPGIECLEKSRLTVHTALDLQKTARLESPAIQSRKGRKIVAQHVP
jgi:hypothetical protein